MLAATMPEASMPQAAPIDALTAQDRSHLRILSVLHYVFAGLNLLGIPFIAFQYKLVQTMFDPSIMRSAATPPPSWVMPLLFWLCVALAICVLGVAILNAMAASRLRACRGRTFCISVSALNLLQIPLGIPLGIVTLFVLNRPSVQNAFGSR
jgi:hypothetical protein